MKTTIEIADALLIEAKQVAAAEHTTLRELVETGLRKTLAERRCKPEPFKLRDMSVDGNGPTPEWQAASWDEKLAIIYGDPL